MFLGLSGIEPETLGLRGPCSNQLSYKPISPVRQWRCIYESRKKMQADSSHHEPEYG